MLVVRNNSNNIFFKLSNFKQKQTEIDLEVLNRELYLIWFMAT